MSTLTRSPKQPVVAVLTLASFALAGCSGDPASPNVDDELIPEVYSLGALRTTAAADRNCPPGFVCQGIEVSCSGVAADAPGFVAVANPTGPPRGVVLFTTGGSGMGYAFRGRSDSDLRDQLLADGFSIVQLRWDTNWLESSPGNDAGTARLGCRPATVVKWVHETYFVPWGIARSANGRCGFCLSGNSGGAPQVSYALSHYGLDAIVDAVVPTGGPPHGALVKACLLRPREEEYWFADDTRQFVDRGFGVFDGNGPCFRSDPAFTERWEQASVATGGSDYNHPATRVHILIGENDLTPVKGPAADYVARLRSGGSPGVTLEFAPGTGHNITGTDTGADMLRAALLASR